MRVLAAADLHGKRPVYDWLIATARERHVGAIVLAGDLLGCLDGFDTPEHAQQHEGGLLVELLAGAAAPVLYIMGNDDLIELCSGSDRVQSIHGRQVECGRFRFVGYQYSPPFMGGPFEKPDDDIRVDLAGLPASFDAATVFVSHSPAFGFLIQGSRMHESAAMRFVSFLKRIHFWRIFMATAIPGLVEQTDTSMWPRQVRPGR